MKSAIVGCGSIARVHAEAINKLPNGQLAAFADIKLERAEEFLKAFGDTNSKAYSNLEEMLRHEQIDVLHICTPHYLHSSMALYAMERNINVFLEKPLAISYKQLQQLQAFHAEAKLGICFQNRYNESVQAVKELLDSGKAGKIAGARAFLTWSRGEKYYTESGWRGRFETEGGGVLINQAIHTLDLLIYFLGIPVSVEGTIINHHLKNAIEVEDTSEAYIQFENANASFYATTAFCMDSPVFIEFVCENMIIRMEGTDVTCKYPNGIKEKLLINSEPTKGKAYWGNGHFACIRHFYDCVGNNEPFPINVSEASKAFKLMHGIYESAKSKKVINLKDDGGENYADNGWNELCPERKAKPGCKGG